jgi:tetratricopeptide (TPR) repeat protein
MEETRKLSVILFADIAGYTALMQNDENKALGYLQSFKETLEQEATVNQGKIVQYFGDGCLLSFDSSFQGMKFSKSTQEKFIQQGIPVRIGLHQGDVLFKEGNVFGDGVNIASRIESLGVPGSVLFSKSIEDQIKNKSNFEIEKLGKFEFKNIKEGMEVFALSNPGFVVPDKRKITGKLKEKNSNIGLKILAPIIIIITLGVIFWVKLTNSPSQEKSLIKMAVMDFVNEGIPADSSLAKNLTEELNTRITGLQNLAVITRESASVYANTTKSSKEIGKELMVDYLLDGSVKWGDDKNGKPIVEIIPILIKVNDNTQVWTDLIEYSASEVQAGQVDITTQLLKALKIVVTQEEEEMLRTSLTENVLAYDTYRKGMRIKPQGHGAEEDFRSALTMFRQSVNMDPDFAHAWLGLAEVYKDLYWFGYEAHIATMDSSLSYILKAQKLNPQLAEVNISLGDYYYRLREYDNAMVEFSKVMNKRPNDSWLLQKVGEVWRRQGLFDQAIETLEKGLRLDPFNVNSLTELAWTHIFVGNFDRALELQSLGQKYNPDAQWNHLIKAFILWTRGGENDLEKARVVLENVPNPKSDYPAWFWVSQSWLENDPEGILDLIKNLSIPALVLQTAYYPTTLISGMAHKQLGNISQANTDLNLSIRHLNSEIIKNPLDFRMYTALGLSYASLGNKKEAIKVGLKATELISLENDGLLGQDILYDLMRIYAILGEEKLALDTMSKMLSVPCQYRGVFFTKNPEFADLRNKPRFLSLLERQKASNLSL